ncbi:MAG TPA: hypothetical protein VEB43_13010 [Anaeromyxobacter sp.]|nr:hypothetical protein [Anaeromyxobacter sp.]
MSAPSPSLLAAHEPPEAHGAIPTLGESLRLAAAAFRQEAWLAPLGLLVTGARRMAGWPALWAAWILAWRAAASAAAQEPGSLLAPVEGALAMIATPRFLGVVGGLWLAGALLAAALRLAWIAGAVPALGAAMAGRPRGTAWFVEGVAEGFGRVLPAAVLGLVLELTGTFFSAALVLASALLLGNQGSPGTAAVFGLAAATALALVVALAVPLALSTAADALVARAALLREAAAPSLAAVVRRFLARPGTFLVGAMLFGAIGMAVQLAVSAFGGITTGFAVEAPALLRLGPELMIGALAALLAGVIDLVWLGTLAVLSSGEARG